ncbi:MAG: type II secretion system protein GspM [Desulfobacteraceae bacterium]|nr:type II secretion system protein GspM [Desulfobacteraceae bacterium]
MKLASIPLTKERKKILAAGAIVLLLGGIYRFYPDIRAMVSVSDEIAIKQKQVATYAGIAAQRQQIEKENAFVKRLQSQTEARLLSGATTSLAAVEIQNILNVIGTANNVKFDSMRVMKPEEDEKSGFIRLPVQFSMNSGIVQLRDILYKIEASPKLLIVKDLDASLSSSRGQDALIRSTITVEGIMRHAGAKNKPLSPKKAG